MKAPTRVGDAELHAFVDGQLGEERTREIAAWLAEHPNEGLRVGGWRAQNEAIRRAFPPPPPRDRIAAILRTDERTAPARPTPPAPPRILDYRARLRRRRALAIAAAFAAGAAVAGAIVLLFQLVGAAPIVSGVPGHVEIMRAGPDTAAFAASAYRAYADDRQRPVEAAARDRAALTAWIAERTGLSPLPGASGTRLLGGRVVPGPAATAAFLLFETDDGERLALVAERSAPGASIMAHDSVDGVRAVAWTAGGFDFGLAGRMTSDRLAALAAGFAGQRQP